MNLQQILGDINLEVNEVGTKALNLCRIKNLDVNVLDGVIIPVEVFRKVVSYNKAD